MPLDLKKLKTIHTESAEDVFFVANMDLWEIICGGFPPLKKKK